MEELERISRRREAQISGIWRHEYEDGLGVDIRMDDGTQITFTFPLDSPIAQDVLHAVAERLPAEIDRLGETGIVVTSYSPPLEDEDEEDA